MSKTKLSPPKNGDIKSWAENYLGEERPHLLAFADDGLIWGKFVDGALLTSNAIDSKISPALDENTLQQAFIFGEDDEIRLFKNEAGEWQALTITDDAEVIKESQILWGNRALASKNGFTQVFDARQNGLNHIVPLEVENSALDPDKDGTQALRLNIHHLIEYSNDGEARITLSRLAGLRVGKKNEEVAK
jgi:CRISPR-associated protein (TIGR03984 family)